MDRDRSRPRTMGDPNQMTITSAVIIPFRSRGTDPLREANLARVLEHWAGYTKNPLVIGDGRGGDAQFNRSAAYNKGIRRRRAAEVLIFTESDMLLDYAQIDQAVELAAETPGLVVPFTQYRYLTPEDSAKVRAHEAEPADCTPESTMDNGKSIGAVNVVSRQTLNLIGQWDEGFEGNWYDDNAAQRAFELCAGPTRWVDGPAHHLYHLPGWKGDHLTDEDKAATARNKTRYELYRQAQTPERIRELTAGGN